MASAVTNIAVKEALEAYLTSETVKVMLLDSNYTIDPDTEIVIEGGSDVSNAEINVTGYTPGYGSSSRKTLANKSFIVDDSLNRGVFDNTVDLTWTALAAGVTIVSAALVIEDYLGAAGNDTQTRVVCVLELDSPIATSGADFTLTFNSNGIIVGQTT